MPGIIAAARQELLDPIHRLWPLHGLKISMAVEDQIAEAINPRTPLADLPIRQSGQVVAERPTEAGHDVLDGIERDAANEKEFVPIV